MPHTRTRASQREWEKRNKQRISRELKSLAPYRLVTLPSAPTRHIPDPTAAARASYGSGFVVRRDDM